MLSESFQIADSSIASASDFKAPFLPHSRVESGEIMTGDCMTMIARIEAV